MKKKLVLVISSKVKRLLAIFSLRFKISILSRPMKSRFIAIYKIIDVAIKLVSNFFETFLLTTKSAVFKIVKTMLVPCYLICVTRKIVVKVCFVISRNGNGRAFEEALSLIAYIQKSE